MFPCIPCLGPRGAISDLTNNMKDMSLEAMKMHQSVVNRQPNNNGKKPSSVGKENEECGRVEEGMINGVKKEVETPKWVAEEEPGVLIDFVSLPLGGNQLRKIRFSEEYFDVWTAQKWWADNCERIVSLYNVKQSKVPNTPLQSDKESHVSSSIESQAETSHHDHHQYGSSSVPSKGSSAPPHTEGEPSMSCSNEEQDQGKDVDWVVEDQTGVFITIRSSPDGTKEIIRVELSRECFGEVKARVWWEENKARLRQQYSGK